MAINQLLLCGVWRWSGALVLVALLAGCGGGGGGPSNISPNPPSPPGPGPGSVTVSGKITFDRIPFNTTIGGGLNPNAPVESPARGVIVEAISGNAVVASTTTNATGDYSFAVPGNTQIFIRAKAQMLKTGAAPTWDFKVLNNAGGDALYVLDGSPFDTGAAGATRNLRAASGWNGSSYGEQRPAAPFAVLDTVYQAVNLIVTASAGAAFEPLNLYWSRDNRPTTTFCIDSGQIGTTFYTAGGQDLTECTRQVPAGIYVLGNFEAHDTDEFDQHVIAHEFGHYFEDTFSRSDSLGGFHGEGSVLDLRLAFGEGWGNAFSAMVLNDPLYRDSGGGVSSDQVAFSLEQDNQNFGDGGWYSEASIGEILWDIFDPANESGDAVAAGFGPIFNAMATGQRTTVALTSIFSFVDALAPHIGNQSGAVEDLLQGEQVSGEDEFASNEDNHGGLTTPASLAVLPIYRDIAAGAPQMTCVRAAPGSHYNEVGVFKFFRFTLASARTVTFTLFAQGDPSAPTTTAAAIDPDVWVYRRGEIVIASEDLGPNDTTDPRLLEAGTYVVQFFDYDFFENGGNGTRCATISFGVTS